MIKLDHPPAMQNQAEHTHDSIDGSSTKAGSLHQAYGTLAQSEEVVGGGLETMGN